MPKSKHILSKRKLVYPTGVKRFGSTCERVECNSGQISVEEQQAADDEYPSTQLIRIDGKAGWRIEILNIGTTALGQSQILIRLANEPERR